MVIQMPEASSQIRCIDLGVQLHCQLYASNHQIYFATTEIMIVIIKHSLNQNFYELSPANVRNLVHNLRMKPLALIP